MMDWLDRIVRKIQAYGLHCDCRWSDESFTIRIAADNKGNRIQACEEFDEYEE